MSKENAKAFVQAVLNDEGLREKTANMKPEEAILFAKEMGYDFTLDELKDVKKDAEYKFTMHNSQFTMHNYGARSARISES